MYNVLISSPNHSFAYINAEPSIIREMSDRFTFKPEGYMFTPSYKAGIWNGEIRLVDQRTGRFPKGLVPAVIDALEVSNYKVSIKPEDFKSFSDKYEMIDVNSLKLGFEPHDYQIEAVQRVLDKKRQLLLSPTSSGKSLMIHMLMRTMLEHDRRVLIIVPNISLIHQLYDDFKDYAKNEDWEVSEHVQKIAEGRSKDVNLPCTVATWQSIHTIKDHSWFEQFDVVIVDECHLAKGTSITKVLEKCTNASVKVGLTGTLDGTHVNEMVLRGLFGPVYQVTKTKDLMNAGIVTELDIKTIILKHAGEFPKLAYADELDYIVKSAKRNKFLVNLAANTKGNTLVLFQFVQKHGKVLESMMRELIPDKEVFFVYGGVPGEERENIRKLAESRNDIIICASYATFSTGVSVRNLHNIIFASPSKGRIRVLQSIGRGLRKHESKDICTLYDIADDLRGKRKALNHTLKHLTTRLENYYSEGFNVKCIDLNL